MFLLDLETFPMFCFCLSLLLLSVELYRTGELVILLIFFSEKNAILPTKKEHAQKRQTKPAEEIETTNTMVQKEMGETSCLSLLSSHCQPHIISGKLIFLLASLFDCAAYECGIRISS